MPVTIPRLGSVLVLLTATVPACSEDRTGEQQSAITNNGNEFGSQIANLTVSA